jgi:hypothetical protein
MKLIAMYLSERQVECLKKESKEKDLSYSELVRRLLDCYYFDDLVKNTKFDKIRENENT